MLTWTMFYIHLQNVQFKFVLEQYMLLLEKHPYYNLADKNALLETLKQNQHLSGLFMHKF